MTTLARLQNLQRAGAFGPQVGPGGVVTYNPRAMFAAQQQAAARAPKGDGLDVLRSAPLASGGQPQQGGGFLGTVLNNPFSKAILAPLRLLDVPRRVVLSGLQEGIDAFGSGDASLSDFTGQVRDESFGVGTMLGDVTDNKWINRGLGFAGDVLLDPMTYLTFGAGKFAGSAGRVAAATKLAESGADLAALQRVGRLGVLGAKGAEREAIFAGMKGADQSAQPGLRFMGKRIAGTGRVAEEVGGALARTRAGIGDALPMAVKNARTPVGLEDAYRILREGKGDARSAIQTIAGVGSRNAERDFMQARWASRTDKLAREIQKSGDEGTIFRMLEGEIPMDGKLGELATKVRTFLDESGQELFDVAPGVGKIENYAPHQFTRDYFDKIKELVDVGDGVRINGTKINLTKGEGAALRREIRPGSVIELPDGTTVKIETGLASEINDKLGGALGGIKVIEDDVSRILQPYIEGISESFGRAQGMKRIEAIGTPGAGVIDKVDDKATKAARDQARGGAKASRAQAKATRDFASRQMDMAAKRVRSDAVSAARGRLKDSERTLTDILDQRAVIAGGDDIADLDRQAMVAGDRYAADRGATKDMLSDLVEGSRKLNEADAKKLFSGMEGARDARRTELDNQLETLAGMEGEVKAAFKADMERIDAARAATRAKNIASDFNLRQAQKRAEAEVTEAKRLLERAKAVKRVPGKGARSADAYDKLGRELEAVAREVGTYEGSETTRDLLAFYTTGVARLTKAEESARQAAATFKLISEKNFQPVLKSVVKDGFERIGAELFGEADAPIVRAQAATMLRNFEQALAQKDFWRVVDNYTKFFKTYATATPGFHVRNGMSATFMNASDGVSLQNMRRGSALWEHFMRSPQDTAKALPSYVTRDQYEAALKAVFASGGGEGSFGKAEIRLGSSKLTNNTVTRASQHIGGRVEGYARMGMALDSILKGEGWEQAAARIKRVHFDYAEVSKMDRSMKRLIPFWTFMSRNVPLQIQQMALKPRLYQNYQSLVRNMGEDYENDLVPLSWQESGAFKISDDKYLAPDLPFVRLQDDIQKLTSDPQRLLADANPLLKVPLETMVAKRQFFQDRPFDENGLEAVDEELAPLLPLFKLLQLTETAGNGETVVDERWGYAARNLIPLLSQYQRLVSSDPYYEERRGQSQAGYVGLPLKMLTTQQQQAEARRRAYEEQDRRARQQALLEFSSGR